MVVKIPQLNSCCCGCTLKTGTQIIGWLQLVGSMFLIIVLWNYLAAFSKNMDRLPDGIEKRESLNLIPVMKIFLIVLIVSSLLICVFAIILLLGVDQNKPGLVMFWIVAMLTVTIISGSINFALVIAFQPQQLFTLLITLLLSIYCLLVVYSYYRENTNSPNNNA